MSSLFAPVKKIICPYDLTEIHYRQEFDKCPVCGNSINPRYLRGYNEAPPFFTQMIGWSGVGKTAFLQSLTYILMQLGRVWQSQALPYSPSPLSQSSLGFMKEVNAYEFSHKMPFGTQDKVQEAYIMMLKNMERWGSRTLVVRDVPGGVFNDLQFDIKYMPYLLHVPTTIFMISLYDIQYDPKRDPRNSMDFLMDTYIETMIKHDKKFTKERRNLVVVLSKADKLLGKLPVNIQKYHDEDPILSAINQKTNFEMDGSKMAEYMTRMKHVSDAIRDWITQDPHGRALVGLAQDHNIHIEFSAISATGQDADKDGFVVEVQPHRVLDPFFWALDFQSS
jgi:hypothetical protein